MAIFRDHFFIVLTCLSIFINGIAIVGSRHEKLSQAPSDENLAPKTWSKLAIQKLWLERKSMGTTPIFVMKPPGFSGNVEIVFKNESASPTNSLKHRYSWSLLMWAILEGHVDSEDSHIVEASSGNTAASLAYMCRMLGLKFTAVVPDTLEEPKVARIISQGANIVKVPISDRITTADRLSRTLKNGFFMNQFKNAFFAEEYHESGTFHQPSANMMSELLAQLDGAIPDFFVHPAGTGGTLTSIGRYSKKYGLDTKIVLADTQFSVYYDYVLSGRFKNISGASLWVPPGMAGVGYGTMGPVTLAETTSLDPAVIDRVLKIPDLASTAAMRVARDLGIEGGTSTGVNFLASLHIGAQKIQKINKKSAEIFRIATILADSSKFYESSYFNRSWIERKFEKHGGLKTYDCWITVISGCYRNGSDPLPIGQQNC